MIKAKKAVALCVALIMVLLTFTGCESQEEKARRRIEESNHAYQAARDRLDSTNRELERVQERIKELESRK